MSKELVKTENNLYNNLPLDLTQNYDLMLQEISLKYPILRKATEIYFKSQSQYMDNLMTVSHPTHIRNLRQILCEIDNLKNGLDSSFYSIKKMQLEIKKKERALNTTEDDIEKELIVLEMLQIEHELKKMISYIKASIRRLSNYTNQYQNILQVLGKDEITEEDFERDEENYHIMKVFEQALCAARARSGVIDEGNHIYFYQVGINGTAAQYEISQYLTIEGKMIGEGKMPTHEMTWSWLHSMAEKYGGSANNFVGLKNMNLLSLNSLHQNKES